MADIKAILADGLRRKMPQWSAPMLATLTDKVFSDEDWIFERKLDGERCLAFGNKKNVELYSRNKKKLNNTYPEIADALKDSDTRFIVDGEIVAFKKGVTSFSRLQKRMQIDNKKEARRSGIKIYYYVFDVLYYDEYDLSNVELRSRKKILNDGFEFSDPVRRTAYKNKTGEKYYKSACDKGWEGIIAKKAHGKYKHSRSRDWLKFKCVNRQEFVIGGFTDPKGERESFGAILIGYYQNRKLKYAGKVGTGFDDDTLKKLKLKFNKIKKQTSPFDAADIKEKSVHWLKPKLVAEVGFTEWTNGGMLRHPRYEGLRDDKNPQKVIKEKDNG